MAGNSTVLVKRPFFAWQKNEGQQLFYEEEVEFEWHKGMSRQVRQRSSHSMAEAIAKHYPRYKQALLEVSTKSENYALGSALSAFNLMLEWPEKSGDIHAVENWFQASKRFVAGCDIARNAGSTPPLSGVVPCESEYFGPYTELLEVPPKDAKRYLNAKLPKKTREMYEGDPLFRRIQEEIQHAEFDKFYLDGTPYPSVPRSAFYDFLYVKALSQEGNRAIAKELLRYKIFTDIEFTPKDSSGRTIRFNTQARSCAIYVGLYQRGHLDTDGRFGGDFDEFLKAVKYEERQ